MKNNTKNNIRNNTYYYCINKYFKKRSDDASHGLTIAIIWVGIIIYNYYSSENVNGVQF